MKGRPLVQSEQYITRPFYPCITRYKVFELPPCVASALQMSLQVQRRSKQVLMVCLKRKILRDVIVAPFSFSSGRILARGKLTSASLEIRW